MFTKEDYKNYFNELCDILKKTMVIYTDLLNILDDRTIKSEIDMLAAENMESFRFIKEWREKF